TALQACQRRTGLNQLQSAQLRCGLAEEQSRQYFILRHVRGAAELDLRCIGEAGDVHARRDLSRLRLRGEVERGNQLALQVRAVESDRAVRECQFAVRERKESTL